MELGFLFRRSPFPWTSGAIYGLMLCSSHLAHSFCKTLAWAHTTDNLQHISLVLWGLPLPLLRSPEELPQSRQCQPGASACSPDRGWWAPSPVVHHRPRAVHFCHEVFIYYHHKGPGFRRGLLSASLLNSRQEPEDKAGTLHASQIGKGDTRRCTQRASSSLTWLFPKAVVI